MSTFLPLPISSLRLEFAGSGNNSEMSYSEYVTNCDSTLGKIEDSSGNNTPGFFDFPPIQDSVSLMSRTVLASAEHRARGFKNKSEEVISMMNSRITFVQNYEGAIKLHISELLRKAATYRNMHETSPVVLRNGEDQFVFAQIQAFDPFQDVSPEEIVHSMQSLGYMDEFMAHATKRHAQLGEEICSDSVFGILPLERWAEDPSMIWAWSIGAWLNVVESVYDFNTATDRIYDMALAELEMPEPTRNQVIVFMRKIQEAQFALMRKIAIIGYDLDHAHFFAERNELYATVSLRNRELDETRNIIIPVNDYDNPETIADTVRAEMAKWDEVCIP